MAPAGFTSSWPVGRDKHIDAAARTALGDKLAALSNHFERAMLAFLDHNESWKGASLFSIMRTCCLTGASASTCRMCRP
jgi:hypothetical protein